VVRGVAWRRRSAQAGNRGVGLWRISWVYGDLWRAAALDLTGQDAFAGLLCSISAWFLQVCRRFALLPNGFDTLCATVLWISAGRRGRAPVWREAEAGTSGDTREVRADFMRRVSTRMVALGVAVVVRTLRR